jgi:DNA repair protein RadC
MFYDEKTVTLKKQFIVFYLNKVSGVVGAYQAFTRGITATVADIRIIMGVALKAMACGLIISHYHPSGTLKPSSADKELTQRFNMAERILDINLLGHIIVSRY